jgi:flagellar basal-body rod protein FlgF
LVRGLYTSANGALVAQANVDVIANNLANVNTSGFKRALLQVQSAPKTDLFRNQTDPGTAPSARTPGMTAHQFIGTLGSGSTIYDTPTVFDQGAIQQTGNALDVALSGPGFFAVRDGNNQVRYTRDGSFLKNAQDQLVTNNGDAVLGANGGPIVLPDQGAVNIDRQGNISVNGAPNGQLAVFEFGNTTNLRPEGANKFVDAGANPQLATATTVMQGAQEKSTSDVVRSMVDLITNERWFDANQKSIQTQDDATGVAVEQLGKTTSS